MASSQLSSRWTRTETRFFRTHKADVINARQQVDNLLRELENGVQQHKRLLKDYEEQRVYMFSQENFTAELRAKREKDKNMKKTLSLSDSRPTLFSLTLRRSTFSSHSTLSSPLSSRLRESTIALLAKGRGVRRSARMSHASSKNHFMKITANALAPRTPGGGSSPWGESPRNNSSDWETTKKLNEKASNSSSFLSLPTTTHSDIHNTNVNMHCCQ